MTFRFLPVLLLLAPATVCAQAKTREWQDFFEAKVRPVLAEHCVRCHGVMKQQGGLRLDSKASFLKGAEDGPILDKDVEKSRFLKAILHTGDYRMPPKGKLPQNVLADLTLWVKNGAIWPDEKSSVKKEDEPDPRSHWAFQPVRKAPVPEVRQKDWARTPVDAFILAKLEEKGLGPNPPADRRTLLRRLKIDLLGLPPALEEVAAFEKDDSPDAYEKLVDRYLASPHYGERWARHWLDIARYADTKGYVFTEERKFAYSYTYRDYVIKAFNDDLPFDQFILQQLAADKLVERGQAPKESQAAMGFLTLGRRFLNNKHDIIDDRIDVVSRGLMGLTVGCARCHDHKYDPIPIADYYSLYGVFANSVEPKDLPLIGEPERTAEYLAFEKKVSDLVGAVKRYEEENKKELMAGNRKHRDELRALQKKVDAFRASSPHAPPRAMILKDAERIAEPVIFQRGNPNNPGAGVPRQFLGLFTEKKREPFKDGSGRLELARAIAAKDNPLTARVIVNRLWLQHFGSGLVLTPSDFGLRSEAPSHPELLDYLAARFVEEGWSLKKMHRLLVLSNAYRQSSAENPRAKEADPENRLLARMNRQRLDFEAMRDGILSVAGTLDERRFGPGFDITAKPAVPRRTVYAFIERQNLPGVFRTFDFAGPDATSPQRYFTTVPQQALFLLNSPFMQEQARALAKLTSAASGDERIQRLYEVVLARRARPEEVELGRRFVDVGEGSAGLSPWERYAQVLLLTNEFMFVD